MSNSRAKVDIFVGELTSAKRRVASETGVCEDAQALKTGRRVETGVCRDTSGKGGRGSEKRLVTEAPSRSGRGPCGRDFSLFFGIKDL